MKNCKKIVSLLLAVIAVLGMVTSASAAESEIIFHGKEDLFEVAPGSVYTETDLFENYKNVMPGDVLYEQITVTNAYDGCDYVKIWMGALLHDEEGNPISPNVLAELEADDRKGELSNLEYMHDFLDQMVMTVWVGKMEDENIIYQGKPSSLEEGFEDGKMPLIGNFSEGESITLNVQLAVDIEMGSEYANRIGEVDWIFVFEEFEEQDAAQTGDTMDLGLPIAVMAICLVAVIILVVMKKRKKEEE